MAIIHWRESGRRQKADQYELPGLRGEMAPDTPVDLIGPWHDPFEERSRDGQRVARPPLTRPVYISSTPERYSGAVLDGPLPVRTKADYLAATRDYEFPGHCAELLGTMSAGEFWAATDAMAAFSAACREAPDVLPADLAAVINRVDPETGASALHLAAAANAVIVVERLLAAGLPADVTDYRGTTPLFSAAGNGANEAALILLDAGASIALGPASHEHRDIMSVAAGRCGPQLVRRLCAAGAPPLGIADAARSGRLDTVQALIELGASLLDRAILKGAIEAYDGEKVAKVRALLDAAANRFDITELVRQEYLQSLPADLLERLAAPPPAPPLPAERQFWRRSPYSDVYGSCVLEADAPGLVASGDLTPDELVAVLDGPGSAGTAGHEPQIIEVSIAHDGQPFYWAISREMLPIYRRRAADESRPVIGHLHAGIARAAEALPLAFGTPAGS